jgi:hypothetical protein
LAVTNHADHYRRLARKCLENANAGVTDKIRATLIEMAQLWLRRAEEQDALSPTGAAQQPQATVHQQQQPQQRYGDGK